eukprot:11595613-Heterocapsa_arctica.AAC.1
MRGRLHRARLPRRGRARLQPLSAQTQTRAATPCGCRRPERWRQTGLAFGVRLPRRSTPRSPRSAADTSTAGAPSS